jgi:hypothetical protein
VFIFIKIQKNGGVCLIVGKKKPKILAEITEISFKKAEMGE